MRILDTLLRPIFRWYFQSWFWKYLPWRKKILWFFCKHYFVVGKEKLKEKLIGFTDHKYRILLNLCGDDAVNSDDISKTQNIYLDFIALVSGLGLAQKVTLSIKNSRFGCFHPELKQHSKNAVGLVVRKAAEAGIQVVFDGERLCYAKWVLAFADRLNKQYGNIGVRMQAYNKNFRKLFAHYCGRIPLSVCKGAYAESAYLICSVQETKENMLWAVRYSHDHGFSVEVDTQDSEIIDECEDFLDHHLISYGHLLNVAARQAWDLRKLCAIMFIYLVYLEHYDDDAWNGYAIRRLVEKPSYIFLPVKFWCNSLTGGNEYWHKS